VTQIAPASSPAYLRHLAARFATSTNPAHRATAERLHAIAGELDELLAMSEGATPPRPVPTSSTGSGRVAGADAVIARYRAAQSAPPPTPEQLAELRAARGAKP
jgi:aminoglycoside phosphotransferase (APT) family kinase protein